MSIKIVLTNNKGGVTKTTSTINIGYAIANEGKKVLLIDFDSQGNLSNNINHEGGSDLANVLLRKKITLEDIATTSNPNLFILPNEKNVSTSLFSQFADEEKVFALDNVLETLNSKSFDYILIDTPPSLEIQTTNSLLACDYVLLPVTLEPNSIFGVINTLETITRLSSKANPRLKVLGAFVSKYDERLTQLNEPLKLQLLDCLKNEDLLLKSMIRTNANFGKHQLHGQTSFEDKTDLRGTEDYSKLAKEIINKTTL